MQSLDFNYIEQVLFMKLFSTSNMEIVTYCQEFFGCDLSSVTLRTRYVKFIDTNMCPKKHVTTFSVITLTISVRLQ